MAKFIFALLAVGISMNVAMAQNARGTLAVCTDQAHQFDSVIITAEAMGPFYAANIEITDSEGNVAIYNGGVLSQRQVELFNISTDISLSLLGIPQDAGLDEYENIVGGIMIQLQRLYDDPEPYISAYLSQDGKLIELFCY